tara:strand:+ start:599 stop:1678 length:1080 start_codon:yes stop_codon:yes gene_type:complete
LNQEIFNPKFIFWSKALSKVLTPIYFLFNVIRPKDVFNINNKIRTILITEYYCIGDILIVLPAIESLRRHFVNAKIMLICSVEAEPLAKTIKELDIVIPFDVPWKKNPISLNKIWESRKFARKLRNKNIDLAIDFRGDIRNNWFLYQIKSKYSIGYSFTGGHYFLNKVVDFPCHLHQKDRALHLISSIGVKPYIRNEKIKNNRQGYLVLHPGAGDSLRSWPVELWVELVKNLFGKYKVAIVEVPETIKLINSLIEINQSIKIYKGNLNNFSAWLRNQRLLVGPDSMAGHLAAYLNIPVISIFGSQNPELTKPSGPIVQVIKPIKKCTHIRSHWRLCRACIATIKPKEVFDAINGILKIK